jgi:hypothetical protein
VGDSPRRFLETLCCDMLARTGGTLFDLTRSQLYRLYYEASVSIPESELGSWLGSTFVPSDIVYAVQTDEGRFSVVQVVRSGFELASLAGLGVTNVGSAPTAPSALAARIGAPSYAVGHLPLIGYIVIRYRTFEKPAPYARIIGGGVASAGSTLQAGLGVVGADVPVENAAFVPVMTSSTGQADSLNPGIWTVTQLIKNPAHTTIKALTPGTRVKAYHWSINGKALHHSKGSVKVGGSTVSYETTRDVMTVAHNGTGSVSFQVGVTAAGKDGSQLTTTTCVQVGGVTSVTGVATASWPVFQSAFLQVFGNIDP